MKVINRKALNTKRQVYLLNISLKLNVDCEETVTSEPFSFSPSRWQRFLHERSFRYTHFYTVDICHQSEWDEVELLLLTPSEGWEEEDTDAGSALPPCTVRASSIPQRLRAVFKGWLWQKDIQCPASFCTKREQPAPLGYIPLFLWAA